MQPKIGRGQSRPGTSVVEFFARFASDRDCARHLFEVRWGDHTPCPRCGRFGKWRPVAKRLTYVHDCRRYVSPTAGTIYHGTNMDLMAWFYATLLFANSTNGMRASFIRKHLGLGSAYRLCDRIRVHMAACVRPTRLGGAGKMVHVDEMRLRHVTMARSEPADPVIVMGLACGDQVLCGLIPDRRSTTVMGVIERFVEPGSVVVTDAHASYKGLERCGWKHIAINHKVAFHNFNGVTNNPIEIFWARMRRAFASYRGVQRKNVWKYLAEVELRYNRRHSAIPLFDELMTHIPEITSDTIMALRRRFDWSEDWLAPSSSISEE